MWLDRFSNNSTPTSISSPAPRNPLQRNGLGIGLGRNDSNVSIDFASANSSEASLPLPQLQRRQTGSALRQEQRPPPDLVDPVIVLKNILNFQVDEKSTNSDGSREDVPGSAESLSAQIDFGSLSLKEYVDSLGAEVVRADAVNGAHDPARQQYEDFHESIAAADDVLRSLENYLTNFKAELGQVSSEIESLQSRSIHLNTQLENRRKVEKLLGPAVEDLSLSPATVKAIADGPIDDTFAKALTEIEARHMTVQGRNADSSVAKASEDIEPLLRDLKLRAVERIRDCFVQWIKQLRSPNINAQALQRQTFLRHKELFPFLSRNHAQLSEEIAQAYANTVRWYFSSAFARYNEALAKLQLLAFDQHELLGSDPASRKQPALGGSKSAPTQYDAFNLGRRADLITTKDTSALPSHLAEDSKAMHYMELPFRNFNQVLLDNLSSEYSVVTELFSTNSYQQVSRRVAEIFEPVFATGQALTKQLVENTSDCLGILICIRLNQRNAFESQKRKVPVMDDYINITNILLWPKFQKAMDMHCESLRKVPTTSARGATAAFSLVSGGDTSKASVAPHPITQRFGQFSHGILTLSSDAGDDEPIANSLGRLRTEYEALMNKLAKGAGDTSKRSRFLFNNYSLVLTIIGDAKGKLAEEQKEHFSTLLRDLKPR